MPTLAALATVDVVVPIGWTLVVTGGRGTATGGIQTDANGSTIGPFATERTITLTAVTQQSYSVLRARGDGGWDITQADVTSPGTPVLTRAEGGFNVVGPDGTRYTRGGNTLVPGAVPGYGIPVLTPAGFRWTSHPLTLRRRSDGTVETDWQITDLIPTPTVTYFVNPLTGNNANSGLTEGLALADLSNALAKSDVDQIRIVGLTADYLALGVKGWNNTQPTRSVSVLNRTGFRFLSCDASATLPTWTVNGTFSNVYQSSAITAANSRSVIDTTVSAHVTYTDKNGATQTLTNLPKRYRTLKQVGSLAAVAAEAGTWFHDGTQLQVRPHDDRVLTGTTTMLASTEANNGRMGSVSNSTIYAENIDFLGGNRGFLALHADTVTGHTLALNNCSFQGTGVANGLTIEAAVAVRMYRCGAYDCRADGFNYHAAGNDAATEADAPTVLEIECAAIGNGTTGSTGTSDNASTAHEFTEVISLGCVYVNSDDAVVVDIQNAHRWMISSHVGPALVTSASGRENIKAANSATVWLDNTFAQQGANARWIAEQTTSSIRHFDSGSVVNASGGLGTVRAYLA